MTKILYLYESLKVGGAEQLLLTTLKYLDRQGFEPQVYCIAQKGDIGLEIERLGIPVIAFNKKPYLWNWSILRKLIQVFNKKRPDILHAHLFYANYFGRIAAILCRVPVIIITEHGTHSNFKKFYHHLIDFVLSLFTDRIIAVSKAVKKYLNRHSLIFSEKITVIYNAVDTDRFSVTDTKDKIAIRKKLGLPYTDLLLGCISTIVPWKGQFILLQSLANLVKSRPSLRLCLVGRVEEEFKKKMQTFIKENKLSENVYFLGERRDVPDILTALDIFILPSLTEGLGIALLEAMSVGLATVASDTEGIKEVIEPSFDGLLFKPADTDSMSDCILELADNRDRATIMGLNARRKVNTLFSPQQYIDELQSLYIQLLKKKISFSV